MPQQQEIPSKPRAGSASERDAEREPIREGPERSAHGRTIDAPAGEAPETAGDAPQIAGQEAAARRIGGHSGESIDPEHVHQGRDRRSPLRGRSRGDRGRFSPRIVIDLVQVSDVALLLLSGWLAGLAAPLTRGQSAGALLLVALAGALAAAVLHSRRGGYALPALGSLRKQLALLPAPLLAGAAATMVCLFLMRENQPGLRLWPWLWLASGAVLLLGWRGVLALLLRRWMASGRLARRVAVIGAGEFSREFIERLRAEPHAFTVVGLYDDRAARVPASQAGVRVRGGVRDLLARSRQEQIDVIVVALPLSAAERISAILEELESAVADVCLTTDFAGLRYGGHQIATVGSNPVVLIKERPLKDWSAARKMVFDGVIGSLALLAAAPLLAAIAAWIRLDSDGPILFRQPRLGFNNRPFICYKFRTMRQETIDLGAERQTVRNDPRITRAGKWLRRLSLDELPQLINVLRGEMSLVGPRPHAPNTKAADRLFTDVVAQYAVRHRMKPGITGWAQVNGWRGETRTVAQIENRVACDLDYIANWSIRFDLRILLLTLTREILSRNAF